MRSRILTIVLLAGLASLQASPAYAAKEVGNGGNAIQCPPGSGFPAERVYDHYEAEAKYSRVIDLGAASLTVDQKVNLVLSRIARLNPLRANLYSSWYATFWQEAALLAGVTLIPVADVGVGFVPAGCQLQQAALQQDPELPGDKRYTISKDIWDQMDANSQAGLILHEIIYREALHQSVPHTNSEMSRYLNGYFSTTLVNAATLQDYIQLLQLVVFENGDAQGAVPILVGGTATSAVQFQDKNTVSAAPGQQVTYSYIWNGQTLNLQNPATENLTFLTSGQLAILDFVPAAIHINLLLTQHDIDVADHLEFDPQGNPTKLFGSGIHVALAGFQGTCIEVDFDSAGHPVTCVNPVGTLALGAFHTAVSNSDPNAPGSISFDVSGAATQSNAMTGVALQFGQFTGTCLTVETAGTTLTCDDAAGNWNGFTQPLQLLDAQLTVDTVSGNLTLVNGFQANISAAELTGPVSNIAINGSTLTGDASTSSGVIGGITFNFSQYGETVILDATMAVSLNWVTSTFSYSSYEGTLTVTTPDFKDSCYDFAMDAKSGLKCGGLPGGAYILSNGNWVNNTDTGAWETDISGTVVSACGPVLASCN